MFQRNTGLSYSLSKDKHFRKMQQTVLQSLRFADQKHRIQTQKTQFNGPSFAKEKLLNSKNYNTELMN